MTAIPTYVPLIPLPAPVTTGTTVQSYTDPSGDVWVAKNGVNSGNWFRARDVLHSRIARAAAWNLSTTLVQFSYDTAMRDPYGMYSAGGFQVPIAGLYLWTATLSAGLTWASASFLQLEMQNTTAAQVWADIVGAPAGTGPGGFTTSAIATISIPCAAGDLLKVFQRASAAVTGATGSNFVYSHIDYLGTG
jgi:hypothetical protein